MVLISKNTNQAVEDFEKFLRKALRQEWVAQGHNINGKVIDEIDFIVEDTVRVFAIGIYMLPYGAYHESGVAASKIPYSGRSGSGGKSMYIQALINYVEKGRSLASGKQAKSIAFAIAETHRKQGMSSKASARFSTTGKRTGWISDAIERNETMIREKLLKIMDIIFTVKFDNIILKWQRQFKTA